MESNGKLSFLEKSQSSTAALSANVIIDGNIMEENLKSIKKNRMWLMNELDKKGLRVKNIMLATVENDILNVYPFLKKGEKSALFE